MSLASLLVAPIEYAPTVLTLAVAGSGALVGGLVYAATRWGARQARTVNALAAAGDQLVAVRPVAGGPCTALSLPERLADLFVEPPRAEALRTAGAPLPPWRAEVDAAVESLRERVLAAATRSAAVECDVEGRRLHLLGTLLGGGATLGDADLLIAVREAGAGSVRINRLQTAAFLSGGVVHDLNNLLNTLVMHAELGRERAEASPLAANHFDRIRAASRRASELTGLLRRYMRDERMTGGGSRMPVRVAPAVEEVMGLLRPAIPRRVHVELSLDPGAVIAGEAVHLHQVVSNLVLNAVQALDGRPDAAVRVAVTTATHAGGGGEVELSVADNGPGLPPAARARCFEPFFTTKPAGEASGTGLGLAVVHAIVTEALGGTVTVEDAPGGGACFRVRIPTLGAVAGRGQPLTGR